MIGRHLQAGLARNREQIALTHDKACVSYADLALLVNALIKEWRGFSGKRVGVCLNSPVPFIGAVVALDMLGSQAFLVGRRSEEELDQLKDTFHWDGMVREQDVPARPDTQCSMNVPDRTGCVTILTSGTTGASKAVNHSWTTLSRPVRQGKQYSGTRWLLTYPLNLYAGTQVFLQSFLNWATLVIPTSLDPHEITRTLREAGVTHASGTPTFWRRLLFFGSRQDLEACVLEQITLGGEIATRELLDNLRRAFPRARIVHIYASTELGRLFSVTDGKEGFPVQFLQRPTEQGIELRIVDGELMARSQNSMIGYEIIGYEGKMPAGEQNDGWLRTGDVIEVRGDRVIFKGRSTDTINVGGSKVCPGDVELALRGVKGVVDVRVYAKKSSLAGQLVAADAVVAPGFDQDAVRAELQRVATERLRPHEVPRILRIVPEMVMNDAFKVTRKEAQE